MARKKAAPAPAGCATIDVAVRNGIGIVSLDRPDVHNAFDDTLIAELTAALAALGADPAVRVVVLAGNGPTFCAGADLNWMKKAAAYTRAQNAADAKALARMLHTLAELPKPTIARVHGAAYGGGVGLTACCDIAVAAAETRFALSEGASPPTCTTTSAPSC